MSHRLLRTAGALGALFFAQSAAAQICSDFGPQTPRDITMTSGTNPVVFGKAPAPEKMNLCNIHLHENAEHRGPGFNVYTGTGDAKGIGGGYACGLASKLSKAELKMPDVNHCSDMAPGDTVEVHWVFTSCDTEPGPGLGACLSDACANPTLRVEAQVFTLVNDPDAMDFSELAYGGHQQDGKHQPRSLPTGTGTPVEFQGSTTGPSYTEEKCSPLQVNWSVRPQCAKLDINSLSQWCADNVFDENAPHGVRQLVTDPALLSPIHSGHSGAH